jgi:hypothetical protein
MAVIFISPPFSRSTVSRNWSLRLTAEAQSAVFSTWGSSKTNVTLHETFLQEQFGKSWYQSAIRRLKPYRSIDLIGHIGYPFSTDGDLRKRGRFVFIQGSEALDRKLSA